MSTTPSANTLFPPVVRAAKFLGTLGSAYAAGVYLTTSVYTLPSISASSSSPRDLALTLAALRSRLSKPLLLLTSTSSASFAFVAYYMYSTPALIIPLASISMSSGSFLSHADVTDVVVGGGWEAYAVAASALATIVPWQVWGVRSVEKRIEVAGEGIGAAEKKGLRTNIVDEELVKDDGERWARGWGVNGVLAGIGAVVGAYAATKW